MNNCTFIGNHTKDVKLEFSTGGVGKASGCIAVKRNYSKEGFQDTDFLNFKCIGKNGESMAQNFAKGSEIALTGSYQRDTWKDNDGNWKEFNYILVDKWSFTQGSKKKDEGSNTDHSQEFQTIENDSEIPF